MTDATLTHGTSIPQAVPIQRFTRTVPRSYVHRAAIAEVLITHWQTEGPDSFSVDAQWPRAHGFYGAVGGGWHDPLLVGETMRQALLLIAHAEYGVPAGHQFLMGDKSFRITPEGLRLEGTPADVTLHIRCHSVRRTGSRFAGMRTEITFHRDGVVIGTGGGSLSCINPNAYARVRSALGELPRQDTVPSPLTSLALLPPVDAALVDRDRAQDVVLSPGGQAGTFLLRADRSHPVLFDHPVDHVPGMLLSEAVRQAAHHVLQPRDVLPVGLSMRYERYVELHIPCTVRAVAEESQDRHHQVRVTVEQSGRTAAEGTLTVVERN
ncbi:ScbA/BarX family gamma-butyrolactone biosynthesis protein [Streptomyces sp. NPDC002773]|uniref:ScbA/BarX family gamma-butyrolactone biosynthesis protein n=1 Tax=Streptomyces sp. NPDC002773 TaxID=3154430 RepID=UPI00332C41A6